MSKYPYDDLTYEYLHSVFTYDSETGEFYHKPRPRDMFKTDRDWRMWNTRFANKKAGSIVNVGSSRYNPYFRVHLRLFKKNRVAHRIAWFMHYGEWPKDQIDHINGDSTDNRIENLRDVTSSENQRNSSRQSNNKSGVTGVSWDSKDKRWRARIFVDYKNKHLGSFICKEDAIAARREAEIKYGFHENHGRENLNATGE